MTGEDAIDPDKHFRGTVSVHSSGPYGYTGSRFKGIRFVVRSQMDFHSASNTVLFYGFLSRIGMREEI
jgi:hypothetical protein